MKFIQEELTSFQIFIFIFIFYIWKP